MRFEVDGVNVVCDFLCSCYVDEVDVVKVWVVVVFYIILGILEYMDGEIVLV